MSWTVVFLLLVIWAWGWVSRYSFGGLIHILLVYAVLMVIAKVIQKHKPS